MIRTKVRMVRLPCNGPLGKAGVCEHCEHYKETDIFIYGGRILCGSCRFFERNGYWPHRIPSTGNTHPFKIKDDELGGGATADQLEFNAFSLKHVEFLNDWIDGCSLSLK